MLLCYAGAPRVRFWYLIASRVDACCRCRLTQRSVFAVRAALLPASVRIPHGKKTQENMTTSTIPRNNNIYGSTYAAAVLAVAVREYVVVRYTCNSDRPD